MIESNNEKTFISLSFYTADEKLKEHEKCFCVWSKNRDEFILSETPGQPTKNRDCSGKTGTVGMFAPKRFRQTFLREIFASVSFLKILKEEL